MIVEIIHSAEFHCVCAYDALIKAISELIETSEYQRNIWGGSLEIFLCPLQLFSLFIPHLCAAIAIHVDRILAIILFSLCLEGYSGFVGFNLTQDINYAG